MSDRSASPPREEQERKSKKQKTGGFKWKEKKTTTATARGEEAAEVRESNKLERGYRDRSPAPRRERESPRQERGGDDNRPAAPPEKKEKKKKKPSQPTPASSPMIIVHINDRLGTKAAIPCLASDSVKAFKAIVAAHIGRQPHEIMLKRQGERPFKDALTLEDYGVSSGVQLDLELDTGD